MKKIKLVILILTVFSLSLSLYGCANKYNSVPLRSVKYYRKHQKQMIAMNKRCTKLHIPANASISEFKRLISSNIAQDCANAQTAWRISSPRAPVTKDPYGNINPAG